MAIHITLSTYTVDDMEINNKEKVRKFSLAEKTNSWSGLNNFIKEQEGCLTEEEKPEESMICGGIFIYAKDDRGREKTKKYYFTNATRSLLADQAIGQMLSDCKVDVEVHM